MTRQYLIGELSVRLEQLESSPRTAKHGMWPDCVNR